MQFRAPRRRPSGAVRFAAFTSAVLASAPAAAAQSSDLIAYGEHLAAGCAPCHRIGDGHLGGNYSGSARIAGFAPEVFLQKLEKQESYSANSLMRQIAQELTQEEREALAAYLALQSDQ